MTRCNAQYTVTLTVKSNATGEEIFRAEAPMEAPMDQPLGLDQPQLHWRLVSQETLKAEISEVPRYGVDESDEEEQNLLNEAKRDMLVEFSEDD